MNEKWKIVKDIKLKDNLSGHYWRQAGLIGWWMWPDSAPSTQAGISTIMMLVDIYHICCFYYVISHKRLLFDGFTLSRVVKFASQVLFSMWQHQELREVYRKSGGFSGSWSALQYPPFLHRVEGGGLCDEDSGGSKRETKLSDSSQLDSQPAHGQPGRYKVRNKTLKRVTET